MVDLVAHFFQLLGLLDEDLEVLREVHFVHAIPLVRGIELGYNKDAILLILQGFVGNGLLPLFKLLLLVEVQFLGQRLVILFDLLEVCKEILVFFGFFLWNECFLAREELQDGALNPVEY